MKPHLGGDTRRRRHAAPRRRPTGPADRGYKRPTAGARRTRPVSDEPFFTPLSVLLLIVAIGLIVMMGLVLKPNANLSKVNGYPAELLTSEPRNLVAEIQAVLDPKVTDKTLTYTEAEVNQYLSQRVKGKQGGILGGFVKFEGVYLDFEVNSIEIYIVRSVFGLPFTVSSRFNQVQAEYKTIWKAGGGSIGSFSMSTKQLKPIMEAFMRLKETCKDEYEAANAMTTMEFGDDQIVLKK